MALTVSRRQHLASAVALVALMAAGSEPAGAQAPGTKTVEVAILDANVNDPNPQAATWGRVTSAPAGIDCPGDCTEDFLAGSTVALTLVRRPGFVLSEWGVFRNAAGPGCAAASVCTLTLDGELGPVQVAAELRPEAQVLAVPEGAGTLQISPAETGRPAAACRIDPPLFGDHPVACSPRYRNGTRVTIRAIPDAAVPGARFVRWSDYRCGRTPTCRLTIRGTVYVNAIFSPVTLTITGGEQGGGSFGPVVATPPGGTAGLCTFLDPEGLFPPCKFTYALNTRVTLRRDPAQASNPTDEWTGSCTGTGVTCTLTMRENEYVRAGTERTVDIPERTRQAFTLEYQGPRGGVIRLRSTSTLGSGRSFSCRRQSCARAGFRRGDTARITVSGSRRVRFVRWADPVPRRPNRQVTVGTLTRVKAIFRRR